MADPNPAVVEGGSGTNWVNQQQNVINNQAAQKCCGTTRSTNSSEHHHHSQAGNCQKSGLLGRKRQGHSHCPTIHLQDQRVSGLQWLERYAYISNFSLCLRGEADEWLSSTCRLLQLMAAQKTWTRIRPLFKNKFATLSDDKLIVDSLANLAHRPRENPRKFLSRLEKLFNVLHKNFLSGKTRKTHSAFGW